MSKLLEEMSTKMCDADYVFTEEERVKKETATMHYALVSHIKSLSTL